MARKRKQKKRKIYVTHPHDRLHFLLIVQITAVYFFLVAGYILLVEKLSLSLASTPSDPWYALLLVLYYFLPFVLALMFGMVFPPLWMRLRNLWLSILVIQFLLSAGLFIKRNNYLNQRFEILNSSKRCSFVIGPFRHELHDDNQNGQIDTVQFAGEIEVSNCASGEYLLYGDLSQGGKPIADTEIIIHKFKIRGGEKKLLKLSFRGGVSRFKKYFGNDEFQLNIGSRRLLPLDKEGEKILFYCRWAPFFRVASWQGEDPELKDKIIDLKYFTAVDSFAIIPLVINP